MIRISFSELKGNIDQDHPSLHEVDEVVGMLNDVRHDRQMILKGVPALLSSLDLTSLSPTDSSGDISSICRKAISFADVAAGLPHAAAVCVHPNYVKHAADQLRDSDVCIASVAGAFPTGMTGTTIKKAEIRYAIGSGAGEIDTVIHRGAMLSGDMEYVFNEIAELKEECGERIKLKVILETCELATIEQIFNAGIIAMFAGADFIKSSTGMSFQGATLQSVTVMAFSIIRFRELTGKKVGIKPSGGIRTTHQALDYMYLIRKLLGEEWIRPDLFRIGASSLADDLVATYTKASEAVS